MSSARFIQIGVANKKIPRTYTHSKSGTFINSSWGVHDGHEVPVIGDRSGRQSQLSLTKLAWSRCNIQFRRHCIEMYFRRQLNDHVLSLLPNYFLWNILFCFLFKSQGV